MADYVTLRPGRPDVPGRLRRRLRAPRAPRPRGDDRGDPGRSPAPRRGGVVRPLLRLARPSCTGSRCRTSSTPTSTRRSTSCGRWRAGAAPRAPRRLRPARPQGGVVLRRRAPAADLRLPVDVRRRRAVRGAGAVRGHHVHGHRSRASSCPTAACTRWPPGSPTRSTKAGADDPLRRAGDAGSCATATARSRGVELGGGERLAADAVVCNADLPGGLPHAARRRRRAARRPPRPLLAVVPAVGGRRPRRRRRPTPPTTTSTSAREWDAVVRRAHPRRRADARPVDPRDAALARRPVAGARRAARRSTRSSRCPTSTAASTGRAQRERPSARAAAARSPRSATRSTS